ncbi:hypothetical protein TNCV_1628941, partial [Trichonephila clavipes]
MLNRLYFPPTLPHSTHIRLQCAGAGYPTIKRTGLKQNIKKNDNSAPTFVCGAGPDTKYIKRTTRKKRKKMLNRLYFLTKPSASLTFICGAGPENKHMSSITKNDNSSPHKIFATEKKDVKSIYFPPTSRIPPTFICGAGPDIQLRPLSKRTTTPAVTNIQKKKMLNRLYFLTKLSAFYPMPICSAGPENQHMTSITKNDKFSLTKYSTDKRC